MGVNAMPDPFLVVVRLFLTFCCVCVFQMLKERLCFDPEFWNLLNLRTHCLELMSDKVMKAAVLSDMKEDEEKEQSKEVVAEQCSNASCVNSFNCCQCPAAAAGTEEASVVRDTEESAPLGNVAPLRGRKWKRRFGRRKKSKSDDDIGDDPEITFNLGSAATGNKPGYSLRYNQSNKENTSASVKLPLNRKREYLSRRVKSQIFKRKGRKRRWLQGLLEQEEGCSEMVVKVKLPGKKRGRKPLAKLEYSYPDNELVLMVEEGSGSGSEAATDSVVKRPDVFDLEIPHVDQADLKDVAVCVSDQPTAADERMQPSVVASAGELRPADAEADLELNSPPLELLSVHFHNYCMKVKKPDGEDGEHGAEPADSNELNGDGEEEPQPTEEVDSPGLEVSPSTLYKYM